MKILLAGSGGVYEVLLIILVVILIFNGLLRNKIMKQVHSNMQPGNKSSTPTKSDKKLPENDDYIDYEEIKE